jgi:hypothetical protein
MAPLSSKSDIIQREGEERKGKERAIESDDW